MSSGAFYKFAATEIGAKAFPNRIDVETAILSFTDGAVIRFGLLNIERYSVLH